MSNVGDVRDGYHWISLNTIKHHTHLEYLIGCIWDLKSTAIISLNLPPGLIYLISLMQHMNHPTTTQINLNTFIWICMMLLGQI